MPDITQITIPSGTYDIKDATARAQLGNLATVATTGSYNDLTDKPSSGGNVTTCILPAFSAAGTQNVAVTGITVDSNPTLDIYIPTAADLATSAVDWAHIYRADTYDGGITFYSDGVVTGGETIIIKGY